MATKIKNPKWYIKAMFVSPILWFFIAFIFLYLVVDTISSQINLDGVFVLILLLVVFITFFDYGYRSIDVSRFRDVEVEIIQDRKLINLINDNSKITLSFDSVQYNVKHFYILYLYEKGTDKKLAVFDTSIVGGTELKLWFLRHITSR